MCVCVCLSVCSTVYIRNRVSFPCLHNTKLISLFLHLFPTFAVNTHMQNSFLFNCNYYHQFCSFFISPLVFKMRPDDERILLTLHDLADDLMLVGRRCAVHTLCTEAAPLVQKMIHLLIEAHFWAVWIKTWRCCAKIAQRIALAASQIRKFHCPVFIFFCFWSLPFGC